MDSGSGGRKLYDQRNFSERSIFRGNKTLRSAMMWKRNSFKNTSAGNVLLLNILIFLPSSKKLCKTMNAEKYFRLFGHNFLDLFSSLFVHFFPFITYCFIVVLSLVFLLYVQWLNGLKRCSQALNQ